MLETQKGICPNPNTENIITILPLRLNNVSTLSQNTCVTPESCTRNGRLRNQHLILVTSLLMNHRSHTFSLSKCHDEPQIFSWSDILCCSSQLLFILNRSLLLKPAKQNSLPAWKSHFPCCLAKQIYM